MAIDKKAFGRLGEEEAIKTLKKNGYRIIEKNYRCRHGEVDIIAEDRGTIAFIEVKTRSSQAFGSPKESVGALKQRHIISVAQEYIGRNSLHDRDIRFDVVSIEARGDVFSFEILKDAFQAID